MGDVDTSLAKVSKGDYYVRCWVFIGRLAETSRLFAFTRTVEGNCRDMTCGSASHPMTKGRDSMSPSRDVPLFITNTLELTYRNINMQIYVEPSSLIAHHINIMTSEPSIVRDMTARLQL